MAGINSSDKDFGSSFSRKAAESRTRAGDIVILLADKDRQGDATDAGLQHELDSEDSLLENNKMHRMSSTSVAKEAEEVGAEACIDHADDSRMKAVEPSERAEQLTRTIGDPETTMSTGMHAVRADYLCKPSPKGDEAGTASEACNPEGLRQRKNLGLPDTFVAFANQEWQPYGTCAGPPSAAEASGGLKDGSTTAILEAVPEAEEGKAKIENTASVGRDAGGPDAWALLDTPLAFVRASQAVREDLQEEQDKSSIEVNVLHEPRADYSQEAAAQIDSGIDRGGWEGQELPFTVHRDNSVHDDPEAEGKMSLRDYKSLADASLGSQEFSGTQDLGTPHGHESLEKGTLKMSGTGRRRGRARQPRFAFPPQPDSLLPSITQLRESDDPQTLQASSQVGPSHEDP